MPLHYIINQEQKIIFTTGIGYVTLHDIQEYFKTFQEDPSVPEQLDVLLDVREIKTIPTTRQLEEVTREISGMQKNVTWGVCAIVAGEPALYGMGRVMSVIAEAVFSEIQVFYQYDEAKKWMESKKIHAVPGE